MAANNVSLEREHISVKPLLGHSVYALLGSWGGDKTCMTVHAAFDDDAPLTPHPLQ